MELTKNQQIIKDLLIWKLKSKEMKERHSKEVEELYQELKSIVERTSQTDNKQTVERSKVEDLKEVLGIK